MANPSEPRGFQRSTGLDATQPPEKAQPSRDDPAVTGELGSEGGSYADLTQRERTAQESDAVPLSASGPRGSRAFAGVLWVILVLVAGLILVWYMSS